MGLIPLEIKDFPVKALSFKGQVHGIKQLLAEGLSVRKGPFLSQRLIYQPVYVTKRELYILYLSLRSL